MIYTVTLNPALDYVIQVNHFKAGQINRNTSEHIYYGGKGINVSCILNELDVKSTALGFIAGFTGRALSDGLKEMGIVSDFTEVKQGMTRINVKMKSDEETEINGTGPLIEETDFDALKNKIRKLTEGDTLVLSGSIPSCMKSDAYEKIIECMSEDVRLVVDAEKDLLLKVLKYSPFLIKPNNLELAAMFETEIHTEEEIVFYAKKLQEKGARNVLVSMAKDGAILCDENGDVHRIGTAKGTVVNSVGAGDSMVAGFLAGYLKTNDYAYALKLGTACGGATAFHSGLAKREEIEEVLETLQEEK
ncbi:MAG TPA: 1-phosphofructokinase [Erysipelotrichaceae bacterium]|nr:1-phosphofructokinase [Erysipelotrichaceae bacterium]